MILGTYNADKSLINIKGFAPIPVRKTPTQGDTSNMFLK